MRRFLAMLVLAAPLLAATAESQAPPPDVGSSAREAQARLRQRLVRLLRERVGLNDEQLRRLAPISQEFDSRRQALFGEERQTRQALRRELSASSPDQGRVSAHIDALLGLQRRRLDLAADEQRALAAFMTPVQRARYLALQEHLRRRTEEMRRRRGAGRRGAGAGGPPGR